MKTLTFSLILLFSNTLFAQNYFANNAWPSDAPRGLEIVESLTIEGRLIPDLNTLETISCTFDKNEIFHPWADDTQASYVSVSEITTLKLLQNFEIDGFSFEKGTELHRLDFLPDNKCLYQEGYIRNIFEMTCIETLPQELAPTIEILNPGDDIQHWFQKECSNGTKAWFELNELLERGGISVQSTPIDTFQQFLRN